MPHKESCPNTRKGRDWATAVLAMVGAFSLTLTSCVSATDSTGDATSEATVRLAESNEYITLNPLDAPLGITSKFYDGLMAVGENGILKPQLASQMPEHNDEMTRWTVRLREGITYSDGSPFTAKDVVATFEAIKDPDMGSKLAGDYGMVGSVTALNDTTVEFGLTYPYAGFPARLLVGIPASESLGDTVLNSTLSSEPVGTGPYDLEDWRRGESMTLTARDDWWGGVAAVENIHITFSPDGNARAQRLRNGEFDGAQLPPRVAATLDGVNGLRLIANPSADFRAISLPQSLPFFKDPAVRVALNLATDRTAMIDGILHGHGEAVATPLTPAQGDSFDPQMAFTYDPKRAESLLDQAGWRLDEAGVREKDGRKFMFTVMYFAEDTLRRDVAQAFASDMSDIGVRVGLEGVDRAQAKAGMNEKAFVLGGGDTPYDADAQLYRQVSSDFAGYDPQDAYSNPSGYADKEVDMVLALARGENNPQRRHQLYRDLQSRLIENPPMVTLFALSHTYVARGLENWEGVVPVVEPHEHGVAWGPWWNIEDWVSK